MHLHAQGEVCFDKPALSKAPTARNNVSEKLSYTTGDKVVSSPAVSSDGTVYVGSHDNKLHAVNPDGTFKWEYTTGGDVRSSPAIGADGTVYVGNLDGTLYAVDLNTGAIKWTYQTENMIMGSPSFYTKGRKRLSFITFI